MKCCGRDAMTLELQVANEPYVLHRCGECDSTSWLRDGQRVPVEDVTEALRGQTMATAARRADRRLL